MTSITIQLDDRTNSRLLELSKREHKKPEAVAEEAIRRRLSSDLDDEVEAAWEKEISRRLEAHRRGEGTYVSREEIMERAEKRIVEAERKQR